MPVSERYTYSNQMFFSKFRPVAWDKTNSHMPIGLQFMAPWWRESDIIRLGAVAELGRNTTQHPVDRLDMGEVLGMTAKSRT